MRGDPGEPFGDDVDAYTEGPPPVFQATRDEVQTRLTRELAAVRGELARMDAKTNTLLAVCGLLLGGGITFLAARTSLSLATTAAAGVAAALVAVALERLLLTVRPNLRGDHGFMRWAAASNGHEVLDELSIRAVDDDLRRADELHRLAVLLRGKYTAVRRAAFLLIAGIDAAAVTAVLAVWVR
jgi:Family of unknown function (DUF5706)